ncbi:MAG: 30S ribosomal protein S4 [Candidatus Colwellbacteria bacterium RIFCSPLOWO2_01_FULL_48_10]|uniref:Small ribosomal subunit protein uS4 n=1 Tax=Candidatus Colwellbacteria bacterium RIFCSPLOWO2_01_FULL_48_10 TaxID=1797690 RepID=A0A1G1Z5P1_9BACT|nr:MAG: 30S ribosomal protein S4 [Candidatus Colwellbacteria bacterium RIFCSPLOWO2_01_FULL_48_10]
MQRILEKRERSLGTKLSIKGNRCNSPKCALIRKPHRPGQHGMRHSKQTEFGRQVVEKQKIRFSYGLSDRQLKAVFTRAASGAAETPKAVVAELESRLDNVTYRLGLADSRSISRKLVGHGHFIVNGRKVTIPSYKVRTGDIIAIRPQSADVPNFKDLKSRLKDYQVPSWLSLDKEKLEGKVISAPKDINVPFDIGFVVDYYLR